MLPTIPQRTSQLDDSCEYPAVLVSVPVDSDSSTMLSITKDYKASQLERRTSTAKV